MPSHTIPLNGRTTRHPKFTPEEAEELRVKGFRFCHSSVALMAFSP